MQAQGWPPVPLLKGCHHSRQLSRPPAHVQAPGEDLAVICSSQRRSAAVLKRGSVHVQAAERPCTPGLSQPT